MTSEQQQAKPERQFCDICWARPRKHGLSFSFQRCKTCGVGVHKECYGNANSTTPSADFECLACQAVGKTVRVRKRDKTNHQRLSFKISERPTECCLCSVDDGKAWYHAMHPIFDDYGPTGRQLLLPPTRDKPYPRLAWAHTLCCLAVSSHSHTAGCVFGCTSNGEYDGEEDNGANSDTSSVNSDLHESEDESITHFVYCLKRYAHEPDNPWTKKIWEQQHELKCQICGEDDSVPSSFRIPVQCSANDESEHSEFEGMHKGLTCDTCYVPMHVGCAIWGRNDVGQLPTCRRIYFFPGQSLDADDAESAKNLSEREKHFATHPVTNIFCEAHAEDLVSGGIKAATQLRYPKRLLAQKTAPSPSNGTASATNGGLSLAREVEKRGQARFLKASRPYHGGGDVRSRLGVRDPTDRKRPSIVADDPTLGHRRKTLVSSNGHHQGAGRGPTTEKAMRRPSGDAEASQKAMKTRPQLSATQLRGCISANLRKALKRVHPNNSDKVDKIKHQWQTYWEHKLSLKGMAKSHFKVLWVDAWNAVAKELLLEPMKEPHRAKKAIPPPARASTDKSTTDARSAPARDENAHGAQRRDDGLARDSGQGFANGGDARKVRAQSPANGRTGVLDAEDYQVHSRSAPARDEHAYGVQCTDDGLARDCSQGLANGGDARKVRAQSPANGRTGVLDAEDHQVQREEHVKAIVTEILAKEKEGHGHLGAVLAESEARWKKELHYYSSSEFASLWKLVVEKVSSVLGYSEEECHWENAFALHKWDEVISLGLAPDEEPPKDTQSS